MTLEGLLELTKVGRELHRWALPQGPVTPKCTDSPTKLIDASDLCVGDAGSGGISAAMDLAVSATDLYVAVNYGQLVGQRQAGALLRVAIRGGQTAQVASIDGEEQALLVVGDNVVIAESRRDSSGAASGDIVRFDLQGGSRTVLACAGIASSAIFGPHGVLATDGQNLYFAAEDGTKSVPLQGGAARAMTTHMGSLAVAGPTLLIADSSAESVFSLPIAGGPETALATSLVGNLGPVVSCGSNVCWASAVPVAPSQAGTGSLMQIAGAGTPMTLAEDGDLYVVNRLVFDANDFFATIGADASSGALIRIPGAGGPPEPMGSGLGLAVDDECLYTGDVLFGVYSVAKTYRGTIPP